MSSVRHINRCHCRCHVFESDRGPKVMHIVACCSTCWKCGESRISSMAVHLRNECPKRVGPDEHKEA